ncbi:hypothetical protein OCU04_012300 [Sclerotinia nivalis]|uniref:Uncharacterized protein n=1 Tax=Sclerotinia nivalis TaxID=352851 RepID=A0A9X0DG00_9HELO|nr:hypothetical protein OCU04_012300 [Sclerotinia nivalis]
MIWVGCFSCTLFGGASNHNITQPMELAQLRIITHIGGKESKESLSTVEEEHANQFKLYLHIHKRFRDDENTLTLGAPKELRFYILHFTYASDSTRCRFLV